MPVEPVQYLRLELEIKVPYTVVLEGLEAWFGLELISEVDFRWRSKCQSVSRLELAAPSKIYLRN